MTLTDSQQARISALIIHDAAVAADPTGEHLGRVAAELRNALQPIAECCEGCGCDGDPECCGGNAKRLADITGSLARIIAIADALKGDTAR